MNTLRLHPLRFLALTLLVSVFVPKSFPAEAAENSMPATVSPSAKTNVDAPLVIAGGSFFRHGEKTPATLRNLIDTVSQRYPDANITIVGADDVVIENLTLQWRRAKAPPIFGENEATNHRADPPLMGVLRAFSEASGRKFNVEGFSPTDFVLSLDSAPASRKVTEVFNLRAITDRNQRSKGSIEEEIHHLEIQSAVLDKRYGPQHPRMIEIKDQIQILNAELARTSPSDSDTTKLIDEIKEAAALTLRVKSGAEVSEPSYQYHPGTHLLIVVGSQDAIDVARKVIAALEKTP